MLAMTTSRSLGSSIHYISVFHFPFSLAFNTTPGDTVLSSPESDVTEVNSFVIIHWADFDIPKRV